MMTALVALKQWEQDTEKPASASEGNAFIDGYQAAAAQLAEKEREIARLLWVGRGRRGRVRAARQCARDALTMRITQVCLLSQRMMMIQRMTTQRLTQMPMGYDEQGAIPRGK